MGNAAWAATYYVDRLLPGSDNNAGATEAAPFLTIAKCVTLAINPGDTCLVKNGTYPEPWRMTHSGAAGSPITISNYPGHSPRIVMSGRTVTTNQILLAAPTYYMTPIGWIVLQGFEISNGYAAVNITSGHDIIIRLMVIHDMYMGAFGGNGKNLVIDRNSMYHNGRFAECGITPSLCNQDQQIYLSGTSITITNNLIYDGLSYGIQVAGYPFDPARAPDSSYSGASNWLISNNTIAYQQNRGAIVLWNAGGGCSNTRIENNIFYYNGQSAYCTSQRCGSGIDILTSSRTNTINHNMFYSTAPSSTIFINGGTNWVDYTAYGNSTATNPNMVNAPSTVPLSPDFSLQKSSPAIDKGLTESPITVDFAGTTRPQESGFDIGAYEFAVQSLFPSNMGGIEIRIPCLLYSTQGSGLAKIGNISADDVRVKEGGLPRCIAIRTR